MLLVRAVCFCCVGSDRARDKSRYTRDDCDDVLSMPSWWLVEQAIREGRLCYARELLSAQIDCKVRMLVDSKMVLWR